MKLKIVIILLMSIGFQPPFLLASADEPVPTLSSLKNNEASNMENIVKVISKTLRIKKIESAIEFVQIPRVPALFEPFCRSFHTFLNVFPMWTRETFQKIPAVALEEEHSYKMNLGDVPLSLFCQMKPMKYYIRLQIEIPGKGESKVEFNITSHSYYDYYGYTYDYSEGELYQPLSTFTNCRVNSGTKNVNCNFKLDRFDRYKDLNGVPFSTGIYMDYTYSQIDNVFPNGFILEIE